MIRRFQSYIYMLMFSVYFMYISSENDCTICSSLYIWYGPNSITSRLDFTEVGPSDT